MLLRNRILMVFYRSKVFSRVAYECGVISNYVQNHGYLRDLYLRNVESRLSRLPIRFVSKFCRSGVARYVARIDIRLFIYYLVM